MMTRLMMTASVLRPVRFEFSGEATCEGGRE